MKKWVSFSSRKTDDHDDYHVTAMIGGGGNNDKSVVQVIRSRFYGKKGKEREGPINYIPQSTSVAQTLSIGPSVPHAPATSSPLASSSRRLPGLAGSSSKPQNERSPPATPTRKRPPGKPSDLLPPTAPKPTAQSESLPNGTSSPRRSTDAVTTTLAQRLNELAVANGEGLLNEDEYRLLRQNLFERFASASEIPSEIPIVPAAGSRPRLVGPSTPERPTSRPLSNFQVELPRPPSAQSKYSITSGVANLFRRASVASGPKDVSDASSVWSATSTNSTKFKLSRLLSRRSSQSSMQTTASRNKAETMSISSRRGGGSSHSHPETPHSTRRRLATPPSSFPNVMKQQERRYGNNSIYNVFDEDHLSSAADIRQEILAIEAEVRRLMDAFTGLEVTTLSKAQRSRGYSLTRSDAGRTSNVGSTLESKWSADGRSAKRFNLADSDAGSIRSATSAGTGPKSVYSNRAAALRPKTSLGASVGLSTTSSRPGSLRRKNSGSSMRSHGVGKTGTAAPVPPLPGQMVGANNSSVSLTRSAHIMASVPEDEARSVTHTVATTVRLEDSGEEGDDVEDIRRRREEVQMRYEARLDYLRAKLKSAELHEKLARK